MPPHPNHIDIPPAAHNVPLTPARDTPPPVPEVEMGNNNGNNHDDPEGTTDGEASTDNDVDMDGDERARQEGRFRPRSNPDFKPRGILKNARSTSLTPSQAPYATGDGYIGEGHGGDVTMSGDENRPPGEHLTWDEQNINLNEINKDSRMKIDEPKTPFVKHDPSYMDELGDVPDFELGSGSPHTPAMERRSSSNSNASPRSRRRSEQDLVAHNTEINAGRRPSGFPFTDVSPGGDYSNPLSPTPADDPSSPIRTRNERGRTSSNPSSSGPNSRSASFSLPDEKSGNRLRAPGGGVINGVDGAGEGAVEDEEDEKRDNDPKHQEFESKRKGHYTNEAEAMRLAQALIQQESADDDDDDDDA